MAERDPTSLGFSSDHAGEFLNENTQQTKKKT